MNNINRLIVLAVFAMASMVPSTLMAQFEITDIFPSGGFPGDTIKMEGPSLDAITKLSIDGAEATILEGRSATSLDFIIPDGVDTDSILIESPDSVFLTRQVFAIFDKFGPSERVIYYESMENTPLGGGFTNTTIAEHENGTDGRSWFDNDVPMYSTRTSAKTDIIFVGPAEGRGSAVDDETLRHAIRLEDGGDFLISNINTLGLENIRLSYVIGSFFTEIKGGFVAQFSTDGGDTFEDLGAARKFNVNHELYRENVSKRLPAVANLTLRFVFNQPESASPLWLDDILITASPEGSANISGMEPLVQRPGKEVTLSGSALTNVTGVKVGDVITDQFTTDLNGKTLRFTVPAISDIETELDVVVVRSTGGDVPSADKLKITPAPPSIASYDPVMAPAESFIYILGQNLYNIESVKFGDLESSTVNEINDTIMEVSVPSGATTGKVTVKTGNFSRDSISEIDFTVDATFPTISLMVSATTAFESLEPEIDVTMETNIPVQNEVSVKLMVSGEGISADDYTLDQDILTIIASNNESGIAKLKILDEGDNFEGDETLVLSLGERSGGGAVIGANRSANILITIPLFTRPDVKESDKISVWNKGNQLFISSTEFLSGDVEFAIYDVNGRLSTFTTTKANGLNASIPLSSSLEEGAYILRLVSGDKTYSKRFVLSK